MVVNLTSKNCHYTLPCSLGILPTIDTVENLPAQRSLVKTVLVIRRSAVGWPSVHFISLFKTCHKAAEMVWWATGPPDLPSLCNPLVPPGSIVFSCLLSPALIECENSPRSKSWAFKENLRHHDRSCEWQLNQGPRRWHDSTPSFYKVGTWKPSLDSNSPGL